MDVFARGADGAILERHLERRRWTRLGVARRQRDLGPAAAAYGDSDPRLRPRHRRRRLRRTCSATARWSRLGVARRLQRPRRRPPSRRRGRRLRRPRRPRAATTRSITGTSSRVRAGRAGSRSAATSTCGPALELAGSRRAQRLAPRRPTGSSCSGHGTARRGATGCRSAAGSSARRPPSRATRERVDVYARGADNADLPDAAGTGAPAGADWLLLDAAPLDSAPAAASDDPATSARSRAAARPRLQAVDGHRRLDRLGRLRRSPSPPPPPPAPPPAPPDGERAHQDRRPLHAARRPAAGQRHDPQARRARRSRACRGSSFFTKARAAPPRRPQGAVRGADPDQPPGRAARAASTPASTTAARERASCTARRSPGATWSAASLTGADALRRLRHRTRPDRPPARPQLRRPRASPCSASTTTPSAWRRSRERRMPFKEPGTDELIARGRPGRSPADAPPTPRRPTRSCSRSARRRCSHIEIDMGDIRAVLDDLLPAPARGPPARAALHRRARDDRVRRRLPGEAARLPRRRGHLRRPRAGADRRRPLHGGDRDAAVHRRRRRRRARPSAPRACSSRSARRSCRPRRCRPSWPRSGPTSCATRRSRCPTS